MREIYPVQNFVPKQVAPSLSEVKDHYNQMTKFVKELMIENTDYGIIQGTSKNTLLKPGAEKLCKLFNLRATFDIIKSIEDFDKPLFHYHYRCSLYRYGELMGQADGSANSKEKKYVRDRGVCPKCGKDTILKDKFNKNLYYCNSQKGGCGIKNVLQKDIKFDSVFDFDVVNSICKMAQKRALIAAVLNVCGASEFFAHDQVEFTDSSDVSTDIVSLIVLKLVEANTKADFEKLKLKYGMDLVQKAWNLLDSSRKERIKSICSQK